MAEKETSPAGNQQGATQARIRVDDREIQSSYTNAVRTSTTPEEVILDFGMNLANPAPASPEQPEIILKITNRVIMNYYSAKRLTMTLSQIIRQYEEQFGELELDVAKRITGG